MLYIHKLDFEVKIGEKLRSYFAVSEVMELLLDIIMYLFQLLINLFSMSFDEISGL